MRYIAVLLLLANLAYLIWWQSGFAPAVEVAERAPTPLLNTGLLSLAEYEQQQQALASLEADRQRSQSAAEQQCLLIEGFAAIDDAYGFQDRAEQLGFRTGLRLTGEPLSSQFRVFLPPAASRAVATRTLQSLTEASADQASLESYLVTRGVLENAIALGVYETRGAALAVQTQVQRLGYNPEIQELPRSDGEIQVVLEAAGLESPNEAQWADLSADGPGLSRTENLCREIAPAGQFP